MCLLFEYIVNSSYPVKCCSGQATSISIKLHPATGERSDQKWVCLLLQLQLPVNVYIFDTALELSEND